MEKPISSFQQNAMPLIGLGTYKLNGSECIQVVSDAIDIGYRHIDTAFGYENHKEIGQVVKSRRREELFLTTKFHFDQVDFSSLSTSIERLCHQALKELQSDYLDLFLIHAPDHQLPMQKVLRAMQELVKQEKVRSIGVSNFNIRHLEETISKDIQCSYNQVEFHPYLYQQQLWKYCQEKGIQIVAYRPFGKGVLLKDPLIQTIAQAHKKTPGQIVLSWLIQKGIPVIPKASSKEHLKENFEVFFPLTEDENKKLDGLHQGKRFCMEDFSEFSYGA